MALKEKEIKVYETSDGKIFRLADHGGAKNHQQSLDVKALEEKLEKQALEIFLSPPLIRKEFEEIDSLLCLDRLGEEDEDSDLEAFEDIIQALFSSLVNLFEVNPHKMRALTRMIDERFEKLLD